MIKVIFYLCTTAKAASRWLSDPFNEVHDKGRKSKREKRKSDLRAAVEYLLSFFNQSPVFSLCAPHPPCLSGLKAAAVFVWSAKTLLPLLAFHQACMGVEGGTEGPGGCF